MLSFYFLDFQTLIAFPSIQKLLRSHSLSYPVGPHVASTDIERAARQAHLQQAESDFDPLPFDSAAARAFGRVASDLRSVGREHKARAYDALIASIAISQSLPVYTTNPNEFSGIAELEIVPLPVPED